MVDKTAHASFHCSHERSTLPKPYAQTFRDHPQNFQLWRHEKALCGSTLGIGSPLAHTGHLSGSPHYPGARASGLQTDPSPSVPPKEPAVPSESLSPCHSAEDPSMSLSIGPFSQVACNRLSFLLKKSTEPWSPFSFPSE